MEKIIVKGCFTILGSIKSDKKNFDFRVNALNNFKTPVNVSLNGDEIESIQEIEISRKLLDVLEKGDYDYDKLNNELQTELKNCFSGVSVAAQRVMSLIKFCLRQEDIDEGLFSSKGIFWSIEGKNWIRLRDKIRMVLSITGFMSLNEKSQTKIQELLDSEFQPLVALRHLQRARKESNPRYKWIDATIAAELGIKECLIRINPDLQMLLLEVPSPPLHTMFGPILTHYGGKSLEKKVLNSLKEGARKRISLLHRPQEESVDSQEAIDYVDNVSEALDFLMSIIYPTNKIYV
jgi:hypothetical protein